MKLTSIILVAISLSMDAFAISICKGLSMKENNYKKAFVIALYFGSIKIVKNRYALPVGLFADFIGILASFILVYLFY